jgi:hypothetical protein
LVKNNSSKYTVQYDLPINAREFAKYASPEIRKKFCYGQYPSFSLETLMKKQKEHFPRLKIPIPFIKLRANFSKLNGSIVEGVFRVSPGSNELSEYIENMKENNFDMNPTVDIHVICAAIKQFLRAIEPPLIPNSHVDECIRIGSEQNVTAEEMRKIVSKLPLNSIALIHNIVHLMRDVASPEHMKVTKMDYSNLAVVFTPSFIRTKTENSGVSQELIARSNSEKAFVTNLFKKLVIDESLIQTEIRRRRGASKSHRG